MEKGKSGVYRFMKWEMYRETVGLLEGHYDEEKRTKGCLKNNQRVERAGSKTGRRKRRLRYRAYLSYNSDCINCIKIKVTVVSLLPSALLLGVPTRRVHTLGWTDRRNTN